MHIMIAAMLAGMPGPAPLEYSFEIRRAEGALYNPWTLGEDRVALRSYVGSGAKPGDFVAPTIHVAPGQRLAIDLDNRLEPCTNDQIAKGRCFNDTNLHTHGLWVSPSGNSDNVLISIPPGQKFEYRYDIPADHPAGTFWYHPHRHGTGYVQVGSGMAGALIVTGDRLPTMERPGDVDILLKDERGRPLRERVMIFQQIQYACLDSDGKIPGRRETRIIRGIERRPYVRPWACAPGSIGRVESPDHDRDWVQSGRFTGINGKVQPALPVARTGSFERWRLIHAGTHEPVRVRMFKLDEEAPDLRSVQGEGQEQWIKDHCRGPALPIWHLAMDGLTRSNLRRADMAPVFPGERLDILTQFPVPGRYCLIHDATRDPALPQPPRVLAVIESKGHAPAGTPDEQLLQVLSKAARRTLAAPQQSAVRDKVISDLRDGLRLSSFVWHSPIQPSELIDYRDVVLNVFETPRGTSFHVNGRPFDHNRIDYVLPLGKAEEWRLTSVLGFHPIHLHVNPFQVVSVTDVQGQDITDPKSAAFDPDFEGLKGEWKDTIYVKEGYRIAFRTRYERFTGDFVAHCHTLIHADRGMMLNLRIAGESESGTTHTAD